MLTALILLSVLVVLLAGALMFVVVTFRPSADTPDDDPPPPAIPAPRPLAPAAAAGDEVLLELVRVIRTQQSEATELHLRTIAALEKIAVPVAADNAARVGADARETAPAFDLAEMSWDPTDNDPYLADTDFQHVAPRLATTAPGDAPDIITHPLGIPGLTYTSPLDRLNGGRVNGERVLAGVQ